MDDQERYQEILWGPHTIKPTDPIPESIQDALYASVDRVVETLLRNVHALPHILHQALHSDNIYFQRLAANNPNLSVEDQEQALQSQSLSVLHAVLRNSGLDPQIQNRVYFHYDIQGCMELAQNESLNFTLQEKYAKQGDVGFAQRLAWNKNLHPSLVGMVYQALQGDDDYESEEALETLLATHPLPEEIIEAVIAAEEYGPLSSLAKNKHLDETTYERLFEQGLAFEELLANPRLPRRLIDDALNRTSFLQYVAWNPSLSEEDQEDILKRTANPMVQRRLAVRSTYPAILLRLSDFPINYANLLHNPSTPRSVLDKLASLIDLDDHWYLTNHPNYPLSRSTPVDILHHARPDLIEDAARTEGLDPSEALALSEKWNGNLESLLEALRLTQR